MTSTDFVCVHGSSASAAYPEDVSVEASDDELIDANDLDGGTERF